MAALLVKYCVITFLETQKLKEQVAITALKPGSTRQHRHFLGGGVLNITQLGPSPPWMPENPPNVSTEAFCKPPLQPPVTQSRGLRGETPVGLMRHVTSHEVNLQCLSSYPEITNKDEHESKQISFPSAASPFSISSVCPERSNNTLITHMDGSSSVRQMNGLARCEKRGTDWKHMSALCLTRAVGRAAAESA